MKINALLFICLFFCAACQNNTKTSENKQSVNRTISDTLKKEKFKPVKEDPNIISPEIPIGHKVHSDDEVPGVIYVDNWAYTIDTFECENGIKLIRYNRAGQQGQMHSVTGEIDFARYGLGGTYKQQFSDGGIDFENKCFRPQYFDSLTVGVKYKMAVPCRFLENIELRSSPLSVDPPVLDSLIGDIPFLLDVFEDQNKLSSSQIHLKNEYWPQLNSFEKKEMPVIKVNDYFVADKNGFSVDCYNGKMMCYSDIYLTVTFPVRTKRFGVYYNYYVGLQIANDDAIIHGNHVHQLGESLPNSCLQIPNSLDDYLFQNKEDQCDHVAKHTEIIGIPLCGNDFGSIVNELHVPVNFSDVQQNQAN